MAALGLYWRRRRDNTPLLLLVSPGLLFAMQTYGGEMLLRIFLFSLPFACFLAVQLLPSARTLRGRRVAAGAMLGVALLLTPCFVLVRYGNQLVDERSGPEVEAVRELYSLADPGALLVAGNENTPWRWTEYGEHRHVTLDRLLEDEAPQDVSAVESALHDRLLDDEPHGLVLLTRQQLEYERLFGRRAPYALADVQQVLLDSPRFQVVSRNADAVVLAAVDVDR